MSDKMIPDLSGMDDMLEKVLSTQRKFAPSGQLMTQVSEAVRTLTQAQMTYNQTVMRANAALISAIWDACMASTVRKTEATEDQRQASRRPDMDIKTP